MDIDMIRDAILEGQALRGVDSVYTFYHDETNNIRKLLLTESGLNNPDPKSFVLGGIVYRPTVAPDWSGLFRQLQLQASTKELKLKHLGTGDFLQLLGSRKLATFLKWLTQRNIYIHQTTVDVLYWSVVDIIDSIFSNRLHDLRLADERRYKNLLYRVAKRDLAATSALLFSADYPDLAPGATRQFLQRLSAMAEASTDVLSAREVVDLVSLLKDGMEDAVLDFIQDGERHVLIGGFEAFYRHVICLFKHANHYLDREDLVAEKLVESPMTESGKPFEKYSFLDSKTDAGIQVADVVAGLLGKYWTYLNSVGFDAMVSDMRGFGKAQLETVSALKNAFDASDRASDGFLHVIVPDDDTEKHRRFLWGIPRP